MESRYVHHNALALFGYGPVQPPSSALHVTQDALSVLSRRLAQHLLHLQVVFALRLDVVQTHIHAVVPDDAQQAFVIAGRYAFHRQVEQLTVFQHVSSGRVLFLHIQLVQHLIGVCKAEALTGSIAYKGFRQVVFQSGSHRVEAVPRVKVQGAQPLHVPFYLVHMEGALLHAQFACAVQPFQQRVGLAVHTRAVHPQQHVLCLVVFEDGIGSRRLSRVGFHLLAQLLSDLVDV